MRINFVLRDIPNVSIDLSSNLVLGNMLEDLNNPDLRFFGLTTTGENVLINKDDIIKISWERSDAPVSSD